jgi:putative glutathione S-transferase
MTALAQFASPVNTDTYGQYRIKREPGDTRPTYRFTGRISTDGSTPFAAEPGRYHIYSGWFCPWAQRTMITRELAGLHDVVSVSYVDGDRDARGWGFRATNGPDPVNGFTLLREAYNLTEPEFDGHVSVPTLWDRTTRTVASNDFTLIGIDLATKFSDWAVNSVATYPDDLRDDIDALDEWLSPAVNWGMNRAAGSDAAAFEARTLLLDTFADLDSRLRDRRYLLCNTLTEADIRLWVTLARYDVGGHGRRDTDRSLDEFTNLWAYARDLYTIAAFKTTTRFETFTRPGATLPDWNAPQDRARLG